MRRQFPMASCSHSYCCLDKATLRVFFLTLRLVRNSLPRTCQTWLTSLLIRPPHLDDGMNLMLWKHLYSGFFDINGVWLRAQGIETATPNTIEPINRILMFAPLSSTIA